MQNLQELSRKTFIINLELGHERMGHGKEMIYNKIPKICFNKDFKISFIENVNKKQPWLIIENYISNNFDMTLLKKSFLFGEFLDYKDLVDNTLIT